MTQRKLLVPRNPVSPTQVNAIIALNGMGHGCCIIGRQLGLHPSAVNNVTRRLGLPKQRPGAPKGNKNRLGKGKRE